MFIDGGIYLGNGVYKSTDNCLSRSPIPTTVQGSSKLLDNTFDRAIRIAVHPLNGHLYIAVSGVILRSTDEGQTWSAVLGAESLDISKDTVIFITEEGHFYATIGNRDNALDPRSLGIYRSTDGLN